MDIMAISTDSPKNCFNREDLSAPNTFRTPTSAALLEELAVDKFMKLIHAINNVSRATDASTNNEFLLPPVIKSSFIPEFR